MGLILGSVRLPTVLDHCDYSSKNATVEAKYRHKNPCHINVSFSELSRDDVSANFIMQVDEPDC